jgi:hypothetical protein
MGDLSINYFDKNLLEIIRLEVRAYLWANLVISNKLQK